MTAIDRLAHTSRWRDLPLAEKALLALGLMLLALVLPPWPGGALVFVAAAGAAIGLAGVPARDWLTTAAGPAGFAITGAATLILGWDNGPRVLAEELPHAFAILLRTLAALSSLLLLSFTTPVTDMLRGVRRLGLPPELLEVALVVYSFLFVLGDTAAAMHSSQSARLGHDGPMRSIRSLGLLTAALLPRAFERARRLEMGLAARGFDGEMRVLSRRASLSPARLAAIVAVLALVGGFGLWGTL